MRALRNNGNVFSGGRPAPGLGGLGLDLSFGTPSDLFCALPWTGGLDMCKPAPSISTVRSTGLDCSQSGWAGREDVCRAANAADADTFNKILAAEAANNPDQYRAWYEQSGASNDPTIPTPGIDWAKWLLIAGLAVGVYLLVSSLSKRQG